MTLEFSSFFHYMKPSSFMLWGAPNLGDLQSQNSALWPDPAAAFQIKGLKFRLFQREIFSFLQPYKLVFPSLSSLLCLFWWAEKINVQHVPGVKTEWWPMIKLIWGQISNFTGPSAKCKWKDKCVKFHNCYQSLPVRGLTISHSVCLSTFSFRIVSFKKKAKVHPWGKERSVLFH